MVQQDHAWQPDARRPGADGRRDVAPDKYEAPKGFSLSLQIKSTTDAERIFHALARGGRVLVPMGKKHSGPSVFGMVVDPLRRIPWLINCEGG
jgi:uncharacterized glyoxalase superfamily protein PhnB